MKIIVYTAFGFVALFFIPFVWLFIRSAWKEVVDYWKFIRWTLKRSEIKRIKAEVRGVVFIEVKETLPTGEYKETQVIELTAIAN
jgi:hypothetical protein